MHYSIIVKQSGTGIFRHRSKRIDIIYQLLYSSLFIMFHSNIVIHENDVLPVNMRVANICMKIYLSCFLIKRCFSSVTTACKIFVITDLRVLRCAAAKHEGKALCSRAACCNWEKSEASTTTHGMVSVWPEIAPLHAYNPKINCCNANYWSMSCCVRLGYHFFLFVFFVAYVSSGIQILFAV